MRVKLKPKRKKRADPSKEEVDLAIDELEDSGEFDDIADSFDELGDNDNPVDNYYQQKLNHAERDVDYDDGSSTEEDEDEEEEEGEDGTTYRRKRTRRKRKLLGKNGPTTVVVTGAIFGTFSVGGILTGPVHLFSALSKLLANHSDHSKHLLYRFGNSYVKAFMMGTDRDCSKSKIKCKFKTISEKQKLQWEKRGIEVIADKTKVKGATGKDRYKVRGLKYNGVEIKTQREFKNLRWTHPEFNSLLKRFPIRANYITKKAALKTSLKKFSLNIGKKFIGSKAREFLDRRAENRKKMDAHTNADVDDDGKPDKKKTKSRVEKRIGEATARAKESIKSVKKGFGAATGAAAGIVVGCAVYNVVRAAQAGIMLMWHEKLLEYALPYLQMGAQVEQSNINGEMDWETAEYLGSQLMRPVTQKDIDDNPELYTQDMLGKTMMDSKGVNAAMNGDSASLEDYAKNYTGWAPADKVWGSGIIKNIQNAFGGKENIRNTCIISGYVLLAGAAACANPVRLLGCVAGYALVTAAIHIWGDNIIDKVTEIVQEPAIDAIAAANLNANLHGPPGGEAIVAASGVASSYMDRANGLTFAASPDEAWTAYEEMVNDIDYQKTKIAEAKYEASKDQFDISNQYTFISQFMAKIFPAAWDGSLFSMMSNSLGAVAAIPSFSSAYAVKDGIYQPIETYKSRKAFDGTLSNCKSPGLVELGIPCSGESGKTIPFISEEINKCMKEEEEDDNKFCIDEAVDYLSKRKYDHNKKPYVDPDTGEPTDFSEYSEDRYDYDNPFLLFMANCARDRKYPLGYSDVGVDEKHEDWAIGARCGNLSDKQAEEAGIKVNNQDRKDLAWMSYYWTMCVSMLANEEDQDYCWEEEPKEEENVKCGEGWKYPIKRAGTTVTRSMGGGHEGADIFRGNPGVAGDPIYAVCDGVVTHAGGGVSGFGFWVIIQHEVNGQRVDTLYGHTKPTVSVGQTVKGCQQIGVTASLAEMEANGGAGGSTGPHLHFERHPGQYRNPQAPEEILNNATDC